MPGRPLRRTGPGLPRTACFRSRAEPLSSRAMIALWGLLADPPLAAVRQCLEDLGAPTRVIDQRRVAEYVVEPAIEDGLPRKLVSPNGALEMGRIWSVYVR